LFDLQRQLAVAELGELVEDFHFQPLEQLEGDVKEVPGAAGGVEDAQGAKLAVKGADFGNGVGGASGPGVGVGGGADVRPFGAQRLDDGGQHKALDVSAGRELRAELVTFDRVQRPLEEGAEDGGFDRLPIVLRRFMQARDLNSS
jgi:hypothetical protein